MADSALIFTLAKWGNHDEINIAAADVNSDKKTDVIDLIVISRYIAN